MQLPYLLGLACCIFSYLLCSNFVVLHYVVFFFTFKWAARVYGIPFWTVALRTLDHHKLLIIGSITIVANVYPPLIERGK